jgi:hypothetical protein
MANKTEIVSPKFSFKGWDFVEFLKGRKKLIVTIVGAVAGWVITQNPEMTAIAGISTELIYAIIEYFIKEKVTE